MFLRSQATPELLRRVNLSGGGCFCVGTQEEQQMDDIRVKMHSRFQSGDFNESFSRVRNLPGADSLEMPLQSQGVQECSAQEACPGSCGPFPEVHRVLLKEF